MKHKWHKEIKAWADGAEIQIKYLEGAGSKSGWMVMSDPDWDCYDVEYRIKPQHKEPQYMYVYQSNSNDNIFDIGLTEHPRINPNLWKKIGKIKLEVDDV
jgi:hypothetical protein